MRDEEIQDLIITSISNDVHVVSLLQILSFNDWIKILASIDKDKGEGLNFIRELIAQIPIMTKNLQSELTKFASKGASLSNHLRKQCRLDPMFMASSSTPVVPTSGSIFNRDPAALEAIRSFQHDMCSLTDSRLLEQVPKVSKVYPFLPTRQIEVEAMGVAHRLWALPNKGFLAPIHPETWIFLANLPITSLEECRNNAIKGHQCLDKGELLKSPFSMSFLDPSKCSSPVGIYGRTKGTMTFTKAGADYYSESIWNVYRPYLKCACRFLDPKASCDSSIIWFDHAVWFVLNHLEDLFPEKDVVFHLSLLCSWLGGQARNLVLAQISFIFFRNYMLEALTEMQSGVPGTIIANYSHYKGVKLINSLFNPNTNADIDGSFESPSLKVARIAEGTPSAFTSFLSPSTGQSSTSSSYGRSRSFTSRGRGKNFPVRNLLDM